MFFSGQAANDYKLAGNSIATPHALVALAHMTTALCLEAHYSSSHCSGLAFRIHQFNAVFVPRGEGWLMCHRSQVPEVLAGIIRAAKVPPCLAWPLFVKVELLQENAVYTA